MFYQPCFLVHTCGKVNWLPITVLLPNKFEQSTYDAGPSVTSAVSSMSDKLRNALCLGQLQHTTQSDFIEFFFIFLHFSFFTFYYQQNLAQL